jgi:hypothetical protein
MLRREAVLRWKLVDVQVEVVKADLAVEVDLEVAKVEHEMSEAEMGQARLAFEARSVEVEMW